MADLEQVEGVENGGWRMKGWQLGPGELMLERWNKELDGGFNYLLFSLLFGEDFQFDEHIFRMGWNHQLENPGLPSRSLAASFPLKSCHFTQ